MIPPDQINSQDPKVRFEVLWCKKNDKDEDIYCDICLDDHLNEDGSDAMVLCDLCNTAVHPTCYGQGLSERPPSENESWYCKRC